MHGQAVIVASYQIRSRLVSKRTFVLHFTAAARRVNLEYLLRQLSLDVETDGAITATNT